MDWLNRIQSPNVANVAVLSRAFSPTVIHELAATGCSQLLRALFDEVQVMESLSTDVTLSDVLESIYEQMESSYRNEYIYKNTIANKILLGRHSLNTASMHTEFRVAESKADVLILNGTSHIYEIKTELDSLDRLEKQLMHYQQFAEHVNVVASGNHIEKLLKVTPPEVGILHLTRKKSLRVIRKAERCRNNLSVDVIFDSLRKGEYINITRDLTGDFPNVPSARIYQECKDIVQSLDVNKVHDLMVNYLKLRDRNTEKLMLIDSVPSCLKAMATSIKLTKKQTKNLLSALNKNVGDSLH